MEWNYAPCPVEQLQSKHLNLTSDIRNEGGKHWPRHAVKEFPSWAGPKAKRGWSYGSSAEKTILLIAAMYCKPSGSVNFSPVRGGTAPLVKYLNAGLGDWMASWNTCFNILRQTRTRETFLSQVKLWMITLTHTYMWSLKRWCTWCLCKPVFYFTASSFVQQNDATELGYTNAQDLLYKCCIPLQCPQCPALNFGKWSHSAADICHRRWACVYPHFGDAHPQILPSVSWPGSLCWQGHTLWDSRCRIKHWVNNTNPHSQQIVVCFCTKQIRETKFCLLTGYWSVAAGQPNSHRLPLLQIYWHSTPH